MPDPMRSHDYDPLTAVRERLVVLEDFVTDLQQRFGKMERIKLYRERYSKLRNWRTTAIRRLHATGKLSYAEMGQVFDISRQRIEQIVNHKSTR